MDQFALLTDKMERHEAEDNARFERLGDKLDQLRATLIKLHIGSLTAIIMVLGSVVGWMISHMVTVHSFPIDDPIRSHMASPFYDLGDNRK